MISILIWEPFASVARGLLLVAASLAMTACASSSVRTESRPAESFDRAVRICQLKQPGRINRRVQLKPAHPGVATCLQERGWNGLDAVNR